MKTKLFLLVVLVVMLFSFTSTNSVSTKSSKSRAALKGAREQTHVSKGLPMEDKDQFN